MILIGYQPAHSQFMDCFMFVIISGFVVLLGQPGPFGWNVTVAIFKQTYSQKGIHGQTSIDGLFIRPTWSKLTLYMT